MHLRRHTSSTVEDGQERRTLQGLATASGSRAREMKIQTRVSGVLLQETENEQKQKSYMAPPCLSIFAPVCSCIYFSILWSFVIIITYQYSFLESNLFGERSLPPPNEATLMTPVSGNLMGLTAAASVSRQMQADLFCAAMLC